MARVRGVLTEHGGVASCIVGVSAASQNQEAKEKPPLHGDPTPQMKHFPPLHGMDRDIMKFSSPTHTQNAQFPTIFTALGRYFFHRGTPHDHTVLRRGDLSFTQPPGAPPAWRTPKEPSTPRDAAPGCGAGRSRQDQALEKSHAIRLGEVSTTSENVAIPTIKIHGLKEQRAVRELHAKLNVDSAMRVQRPEVE